MITVSPTYLFIWKKWVSVQPSGVFSCHSNQMTMTTSGQNLSCPDYRKTKENVNITLCEVGLLSLPVILFPYKQVREMVIMNDLE